VRSFWGARTNRAVYCAGARDEFGHGLEHCESGIGHNRMDDGVGLAYDNRQMEWF